MGSLVKSFVLVPFALLLTLVLFPPPVYSQTPRSYTSPIGSAHSSYKLVLYSPTEETAYQNVMPLNFTLKWSFNRMIPFDVYADYAYRIDDNPFVNITPN